jgi:hypothetical protein
MRNLVAVALTVQVLLLNSACNPCKASKGPAVSVDFSSVALSGAYLCDTNASCKLTFQNGIAVMDVLDEGKRFEFTYLIEAAGTQQQRQEVVYETNFGGAGNCSTTAVYREETWTLPSLALRLQRTVIDGRETVPMAGTFINRRPASWYESLRTSTHFIDRTAADAYLGVTLAGEGVGASHGDPLVVTRDGHALQIGTTQ